MKTVLLTLLILFISQGAYSQVFTIDARGIMKCPTAQVGAKGAVNGVEYEAVDRALLIQRRDQGADLTKVCTSLVTNMSSLFRDKNFNQAIGNWDVSKVTDMNHLFHITSFNQPISEWDVSNVTNMYAMFAVSPFNQNINKWNVGKVTNMSHLFWNTNFNQPLSNWNVSSVRDMSMMFNDSNFNHNINNWNVESVRTMRDMFSNSPFDQPLSNWNVANVTDMHAMFARSNFNQDISKWDVRNVKLMSLMFHLGKFNSTLHDWDVGNVTTMEGMFSQSPFNQPIGNWNVTNVRNMNAMFNESSFNQSLGNWDVRQVTNMSWMFRKSPYNQPIGNWNVSNVQNMEYMFSESPFNQSLNNWNVSNVTNMSKLFASSQFNQPLDKWDVRNVHNMYDMFAATPFNHDISDWNVSKVINMTGMFYFARNFNKSLNKWCVTNVDAEPYAFSWGSPLTAENKPIWGTCPGLPIKTELASPQNNVSNFNPKPSFSWGAISNASKYQIEITENNSVTVLDTLIQSTQLTLNKALKTGTVHSWRVRGVNETRKLLGEWSSIWNFTTLIIPTPQLIAPANGSTGISSNVALNWTPTSNTTDYQLQISTSTSFITFRLNSTVSAPPFALAAFQPGDPTSFYWRVRSNSAFGPGAWSPTWTFTRAKLTSTGDDAEVPAEYSLAQNFPNPFNPTTQISFTLPRSATVRLEVFNSLGQPVSVIAEGQLPAGAHTYAFDGAALSSGVYLYRLTTADFVQTRVMALVK